MGALDRLRVPDFPPEAELPTISITNRPMRAVTAEALDALRAANHPYPTVFAAFGGLARVRQADAGPPGIEPLTKEALRGLLDRSANWVAERKAGDSWVPRPVVPPTYVVDDVYSQPAWPMPPLETVSACPLVGVDGHIHYGPGYDPEVRAWIESTTPAVPTHPTDADLTWARNLILDDLLGDFPFATPADRTNAVALVLVPFLRPMIDGPTPLHLVESPTEGTGKGLCTQVCLTPALGRPAAVMTIGRDDDEIRKRITAALIAATPAVVMDNLERIDSASFASALTEPIWSDRLLGASKQLHMPIRCVWAATGNNLTLTGEIARRVLRIRLDAGIANPHERKGWKHPKLATWAKENRNDLVRAVLIIIARWIAEGKPLQAEGRMGRFESWEEILGGVLAVVGLTGLAGNAEELRGGVIESAAWAEFADKWWTRASGAPAGVKDLWVYAADIDGLGVTGTSERALRTSFGLRLAKMRDRVIGGTWRLSHAGVNHQATMWQLTLVAGRSEKGSPGSPKGWGTSGDLASPRSPDNEVPPAETAPFLTDDQIESYRDDTE